ncbi:TolC family protein [Calycomorphotria hydatis]|uniref:Outer membrane efflux protein n=1 Tax=Calycomorphotria hydatis TaxID=2528027 RepID=A0A517T681_9PLAN|nr:TolC family protein [Calycomorphotria hydatis]QDT63858.1 Outer membrane efflux protein [Calycomorphotria hydatis]
MVIAITGCRHAEKRPHAESQAAQEQLEIIESQNTSVANQGSHEPEPDEAGSSGKAILQVANQELVPLPKEFDSPSKSASGDSSLPNSSSVEDLYRYRSQNSIHSDLVETEVLEDSVPIEDQLRLNEVVDSIYSTFPLLRGALEERRRALGEQVEASGAYDFKLKGAFENQPVGFYRTYRQSVGFDQQFQKDGASVFGGYRVGRGFFEPWYLERQTNDGGEFKAGIKIPLLQDRPIDPQRAALWRAQLERVKAEPIVQTELITFVREGSIYYWNWVAAGEKLKIAQGLLELAVTRNQGIRQQVEAGELDPPVLQDNERLILSREAIVIEAQRKFREATVKLSLYYRDYTGQPILADNRQRPEFPPLDMIDSERMQNDIQLALESNPVLKTILLERRQNQVDIQLASNQLEPTLDAVVTGSQDVGYPTSPKKDKSRFELEGALFLDVPLQRRKARGKLTILAAKRAQLDAKYQMTKDKIAADVQAVYAALQADSQRVSRAVESANLARVLAQIEREKFRVEESDLLAVNIREQQAAEAESTIVDTKLDYFISQADYRAVLAQDQVP